SDATVTITFASAGDAALWQALHAATLPPLAPDPFYASHVPLAPLVRWTYWNGTAWTAIKPPPATAAATWSFTFKIPGDMAPSTVAGRTARWLRAALLAWPKAPVPTIQGATLSASLTVTGVAPDRALFNGQKVDLSMDFYPLGQQ